MRSLQTVKTVALFRPRRLLRWLLPVLLPIHLWGLEEEWIDSLRPRMDSLFAALDPAHPSVAASVQSWQQGNDLEACASLIAYTRAHPPHLPGLEPTLVFPSGARERAEAFLTGQSISGSRRVPLKFRPDGGLDWEQRSADGDKEFAWMLNRHLFVVDLLEAGHNDPRLYEAADEVLADWILANPYPNRLTFSPAWRSLEVARRLLDTWGPHYDQLRQADVLSDETLLLLLSSIPEHADALHEHASVWGGNHLITEKAALVLAGLLWPEFRDAETWKTAGLQAVSREVLAQTYPDGAYMELSNHYQRVVLNNVQHVADLLRLADEPLDPALQTRLAAMWNYFAGVTKPNGTGPLNNAADREANATTLLPAAQSWNREDWLFTATHGEEGVAPTGKASRLYRWAGHAVFRDDWTARSDWAFFDYGPAGTAHQHDDALHLSVVLAGNDFLVDSGRYTYRPGPWKDYFAGPRAHNVVTFRDHQRRARPFKSQKPWSDWLFRDAHAQAVGGEQWFDPENQTPGGSWRQRRVVLHLVNQGFVVIDQLLGFGPAEITFRWHFAPGLEQAAITQNFRLESARPPVETTWRIGSEDPVAGWYSHQYGILEPSWERADVWRITGPQTMIWSVGISPEVVMQEDGKVVIVETADRTYRVDPDTFSVESLSAPE